MTAANDVAEELGMSLNCGSCLQVARAAALRQELGDVRVRIWTAES